MKNSFRDPKTGILKAWGYTDKNHDGDLVRPESDEFALEPGKWRLAGDKWVEMVPAIADIQADALRAIDADVDAIYAALIGNRQAEYDTAESEAKVYEVAGYTGTVPASVQAWATAKKWTAKQAADDILATSAAWRAAQADIRANRLARKEDVRNAKDAPAVEAIMTTWAAYVQATRTALGA